MSWRTAVFGLMALGALVCRGCGEPGESGPKYATFSEEVMATTVSVTVPEDAGADAADAVFDVFRDVDAQMSEWKPSSPLTAVNEAAGRAPVKVPEELRALIRRGIEIGRLTDGAFDVTWAALWGLWDFRAEEPHVPAEAEIARRTRLVDDRRIEIDDESGTVYLPAEGMKIGLGGIAKGYGLDRAAAALRARGVESFLIAGGGQMMVGGRRGDRPWRVGIRDPRKGPGQYLAYVELADTSVSTSGDYERFFILDGIRYHHILDPRTGRPARGLRSVTVICADATLADALSTAMMVLGREKALALAARLDEVEAVLVDDEGQLFVTRGLQGTLRLVHLPAS